MGRRVLIADANVDAAESLALLLRLCGHDCATTRTGPDALAAAAAHAPDTVFLAIDLPGLDGYEVCRRLGRGAAVLVFPVTAGDDIEVLAAIGGG